MIKLLEDIKTKEIPENESPKKVANIVEKIFHFCGQKKGREPKILFPKKMLQSLPALAQVKSRNTSENVLNVIRQIIYSLYQTK